MYQTTIKCKSLRLAERFPGENIVCNEAKGRIKREDIEEYTEASLEGNTDKTHFYFSFPVDLLDSEMRIGDEIIVTFERKNK